MNLFYINMPQFKDKSKKNKMPGPVVQREVTRVRTTRGKERSEELV